MQKLVSQIKIGSSPPARGPRGLARLAAPVVRLIPACAGTTGQHPTGRRLPGAHPRLRGDHQTTKTCRSKNSGSSPPARGPQVSVSQVSSSQGLIPACAGTTERMSPSPAASWAHPRLRGDHSSDNCFLSSTRGSSPPARGPRSRRRPPPWRTRLIPACAGTTVPIEGGLVCARAHPRLRGDHLKRIPCACPISGSSPPARGPP